MGEDTDNRCALSGKDELANGLLNWLAGKDILTDWSVRDCLYCNVSRSVEYGHYILR